MNNPLAILLGLVIIGFIVLDLFVLQSGMLVFLGKKFLELLNWVAFWR